MRVITFDKLSDNFCRTKGQVDTRCRFAALYVILDQHENEYIGNTNICYLICYLYLHA